MGFRWLIFCIILLSAWALGVAMMKFEWMRFAWLAGGVLGFTASMLASWRQE